MADRPKVYVPMTLDEADTFLSGKSEDNEVLAMIDLAVSRRELSVLVYAETLRVHERIDEIENQAADMMSPDAMMDMATKFLGGGLTP
jgi:hypothetical protein